MRERECVSESESVRKRRLPSSVKQCVCERVCVSVRERRERKRGACHTPRALVDRAGV